VNKDGVLEPEKQISVPEDNIDVIQTDSNDFDKLEPEEQQEQLDWKDCLESRGDFKSYYNDKEYIPKEILSSDSESEQEDEHIGSEEEGEDDSIGSEEEGEDDSIGSDEEGEDDSIGSDEEGEDDSIGSDEECEDDSIGSDEECEDDRIGSDEECIENEDISIQKECLFGQGKKRQREKNDIEIPCKKEKTYLQPTPKIV